MEQINKYRKIAEHYANVLQKDPNVLCILLGGSTHYGFLDEDSNLNLIVIVSDGKIGEKNYSCYYEDVIVNIDVCERVDYVKVLSDQEGSIDLISYIVHTEVLYTCDRMLTAIKEECASIGKDAAEVHIFFDLTEIILYMHIIKKWLIQKKDISYIRSNFMMVTPIIARIEFLKKGMIPPKDKVALAKQINPEIMSRFYEESVNKEWTQEQCYEGLQMLEHYVNDNIVDTQRVITKLFSIQQKDVLTVNEIAKHYGVYAPFVNIGCQYLVHKKILGHSVEYVSFLKKGNVKVEESAYYLLA